VRNYENFVCQKGEKDIKGKREIPYHKEGGLNLVGLKKRFCRMTESNGRKG